MALKGTDVVKKLPESGKKNCKECGFPTCFAFAMKLASGGTSLDKCPHISPETKAELLDALAPAIKLVTIGTGENALQIGNEEVVYRHEKTFLHPTGVALLISDTEPESAVAEKIRKIRELRFERVGIVLKADLLALRHDSGDRPAFASLVKKVCAASDAAIMLISEDVDALFEARDACAGRRPLLYPVTKDNIDRFIDKLKGRPTPVGVKAGSIEELIPLTGRLRQEKLDELVIDPGSRNLMDGIRDQTLIRRAAIKQNFRHLGYPTIAFPCSIAKDPIEEALLAAAFIVKYAAIVVLSDFDRNTLLPLLTQRLNVYTDPRMPLSVKEGIYEVGEPKPDSPVLVTSNWALTYFIVSSEVEGSKVPAFLCVKDTEGLGVLTGWAAGKFTGDSVAAFIKKSGVEQRAKTRTLLIPGMAGRIRGDLEEALPGWKIMVGPREASEIPSFLPGFAATLKQHEKPDRVGVSKTGMALRGSEKTGEGDKIKVLVMLEKALRETEKEGNRGRVRVSLDEAVRETQKAGASDKVKVLGLLEKALRDLESGVESEGYGISAENPRAVPSTPGIHDDSDPYIVSRHRRVAHLACSIAGEMGLDNESVEAIRTAAMLHDFGEFVIPTETLNKPVGLTKAESDVVKSHPKAGSDILKTLEFQPRVAEIVVQHHERMDGSGYPSGLKGDQIALESRVLAVADVVEAMTSHRPYRPTPGIEKALDEISRNSGTKYDPKVVGACLKLFQRGFNTEPEEESRPG